MNRNRKKKDKHTQPHLTERATKGHFKGLRRTIKGTPGGYLRKFAKKEEKE